MLMAPSKGNDDNNNSNNNSKNNKNKDNNINGNEKINRFINEINYAINNKEELKNIREIYQVIYDCLFTTISLKDFTGLSLNIIISSLQNYIISFQENLNEEILELMEQIMFMCLFHFHLKIISLGYSILKFLLEITDFSYQEELLMNIIKIIQIINLKRNIGNGINSITSVIISNLSSSLFFIINNQNSNQKVKKIFGEFILKNISETNFIYLLTLSCSSDNNFSSSLNTDMIRDILDKFKTELNKKFNQLNDYINKNYDNPISSKSILEQIFDKIGCICKIIDSFTIRGHRTYNIDKIIKNLIPISRKILNVLFSKINNENIILSIETISNIINFIDAIDSFDNEYILKTLNWNQQILENNIEYLISTHQIIEILTKITIKNQDNDNNKKNICLIIIQIIENILSMNNVIIDISIPYYLIKIKNCVDKIQFDFIIEQNKFPKTYNFFNDECNISEIKYDRENFDFYIKEYIKSIKESNGESDKYFDYNFIGNCIEKFEEFKNSMKKIYNLNNSTDTDNKIENFKKKIKCKNLKPEEFESFFLETSIEMFKELFKQ